jgi:hypothetical protein
MLGNNMSMKLGLSAFLFFGILVLALGDHIQDGWAQSTQDTNLTGTWQADDGGTYYLRNIANDVWWLGISGNDDGSTFSNVLKGRIHENNNTITAVWADIPRGTNEYYGTLTLSIDSDAILSKNQ